MNLALKQARTELMDLVEPVIYKLKVHYNCPRPWMVFKDLQPLFAGDDWRNPRHPAYPSGHAVTAKLWATLLAKKYPDKAKELHGLAEAIAKRRVHAGLHFEADCEYGLKLGEWMGEVVIKQVANDPAHGKLKLFAKAYNDLP